MKLWTMPYRASKTDGSQWKVLTKHPVVEGMEGFTSTACPWKTHEQYEKTKAHDTERWVPQVRAYLNDTGERRETAPEGRGWTRVEMTHSCRYL